MVPDVRYSPPSAPTSTVSAFTPCRSGLDAYISSAFITMKNWLKHKHWWANVGFIKDFCSEQYQCSIRSPQIPLLPFCALPRSPPAPSASNSQHLCDSSSENTEGSQIDRPWATGATFPPQWARSTWGFIPFLHPMLDQWLTSAGVWKPSSPPLVGTTLSWTYTPEFPCGIRLTDFAWLTC